MDLVEDVDFGSAIDDVEDFTIGSVEVNTFRVDEDSFVVEAWVVPLVNVVLLAILPAGDDLEVTCLDGFAVEAAFLFVDDDELEPRST